MSRLEFSPMNLNILEGYARPEDFGRENHISTKTIAKYRKQPNGLPYVLFANKPVDSGRSRPRMARAPHQKSEPKPEAGMTNDPRRNAKAAPAETGNGSRKSRLGGATEFSITTTASASKCAHFRMATD